jgi:hypothetical protein
MAGFIVHLKVGDIVSLGVCPGDHQDGAQHTCWTEALKKALDRALGDRVDSISVVDLLKEIEMHAVVRQSNHVNTLALITAKRESDEPVRKVAAHLRGLAAVCDQTVTCTCMLKVSEVNKWVLMSLISGLNDETLSRRCCPRSRR